MEESLKSKDSTKEKGLEDSILNTVLAGETLEQVKFDY